MPPLRIFLVENDPDTRRFFTMYLERLGHDVRPIDSRKLVPLLEEAARERTTI
jgi:CheY-like chemotaxis protein